MKRGELWDDTRFVSILRHVDVVLALPHVDGLYYLLFGSKTACRLISMHLWLYDPNGDDHGAHIVDDVHTTSAPFTTP